MRCLPKESEQGDVIRTQFTELIGRCQSLKEEGINAIEEWKDIVPGANVKTQIGEMMRLRESQASLEEQLERIRSALELLKGEKAELENQLHKTMERYIRKLWMGIKKAYPDC